MLVFQESSCSKGSVRATRGHICWNVPRLSGHRQLPETVLWIRGLQTTMQTPAYLKRQARAWRVRVLPFIDRPSSEGHTQEQSRQGQSRISGRQGQGAGGWRGGLYTRPSKDSVPTSNFQKICFGSSIKFERLFVIMLTSCRSYQTACVTLIINVISLFVSAYSSTNRPFSASG